MSHVCGGATTRLVGRTLHAVRRSALRCSGLAPRHPTLRSAGVSEKYWARAGPSGVQNLSTAPSENKSLGSRRTRQQVLGADGEPVSHSGPIDITSEEAKLFQLVEEIREDYYADQRFRVTGSWARNRLLGRPAGGEATADTLSPERFINIDIGANPIKYFALRLRARIKSLRLLDDARAPDTQDWHFKSRRDDWMSQQKRLVVYDVYGLPVNFYGASMEEYRRSRGGSGELPTHRWNERNDIFTTDLLYYCLTDKVVKDPTESGLQDLESRVLRLAKPPVGKLQDLADNPQVAFRALSDTQKFDMTMHSELSDMLATRRLHNSVRRMPGRHRTVLNMLRDVAPEKLADMLEMMSARKLDRVLFKAVGQADGAWDRNRWNQVVRRVRCLVLALSKLKPGAFETEHALSLLVFTSSALLSMGEGGRKPDPRSDYHFCNSTCETPVCPKAAENMSRWLPHGYATIARITGSCNKAFVNLAKYEAPTVKAAARIAALSLGLPWKNMLEHPLDNQGTLALVMSGYTRQSQPMKSVQQLVLLMHVAMNNAPAGLTDGEICEHMISLVKRAEKSSFDIARAQHAQRVDDANPSHRVMESLNPRHKKQLTDAHTFWSAIRSHHKLPAASGENETLEWLERVSVSIDAGISD